MGRRFDQPVVRKQKLDHVLGGQLAGTNLPRQLGHRPVEAHVRLGRRLPQLARRRPHLREQRRRSLSAGNGARPSAAADGAYRFAPGPAGAPPSLTLTLTRA